MSAGSKSARVQISMGSHTFENGIPLSPPDWYEWKIVKSKQVGANSDWCMEVEGSTEMLNVYYVWDFTKVQDAAKI